MEDEFKKLGILKTNIEDYLIALRFLRSEIMYAKHDFETAKGFEERLKKNK